MKVIDNFLNKKDFSIIQKDLLSNSFPWYFQNTVIIEGDDDYFFCHLYYTDVVNSDFYKTHIIPILNKINVSEKQLIRAKANLYPRSQKSIKHCFHTDRDDKHKVCLLNMNTNNGYTEFTKEHKVFSKENSAVIFNGNIRHRSVTQTDTKSRINININYYD